MFIMLIQCPLDKTSNQQELRKQIDSKTRTYTYYPQKLQDYNPFGLRWIKFYETLFNKSSSHSILKELFRLSKISVRRENEIVTLGSLGEKAAMRVPSILLKMFADKANLQYRKIEALLTSKQDLENFSRKLPLESLENESEMCIHQADCLQSIGET